MSEFQEIYYNKSFSQLAKESRFTFNLYRGRVDWKKLEELDLDRMVRDQDVELLNIHLSSVTNCSLESEYDVKILDPNFIKLFRLAQLLIDFLLHCMKYLEHCIKVAYESLQSSNKEIEILKKQLQARKTEVKQLKKKIKQVKQQVLLSPGMTGSTFQCSLCGKVFMNEMFLHGHHTRRHQQLPYSLVLRPFNATPATSPPIKKVPQESGEKCMKTEEISSIKKKYQEEIEDLKKLFFAEIEKLKQKDNSQKPKTDIQTQFSLEEKQAENENGPVQQREESNKGPLIILQEPRNSVRVADETTKSKALEYQKVASQNKSQTDQESDEKQLEENGSKTDPEHGKDLVVREGEWLARLESRDAVWRARLAALDQQHKQQVRQLQDKLDAAQLQGQEMKKDLEQRLEEVLAKFEASQKHSEKNIELSIQDNERKQTSNNKRKEEKPEEIKTPCDKIPLRDSPKQPPPFQKRRAFVSQKSKTIQDSFEILENNEPPENIVQVLNPDDDSDLENVSTLTQNSSRGKKLKTDIEKRESTVEVIDKADEILSKSKNKESIIAKLLEEERLRNFADKKSAGEHKGVEDEDSTLSGSVTETESESGEEGGKEEREGGESQSSDDQMLREESDLAQQSLQSMEAILAANPGILQQLRSDLEGLVGRRLHNLGVDPTWRGLPAATYTDKMAALAHQRNITAKSHPVYFTLRDKLCKDVESAAVARSKSARSSSTADSLLSRLRSKAAQVIKAARFTRRLGSEKSREPKQNLSALSSAAPLAASSPQLTPLPAHPGRNTSAILKVQSADGESFSLSSSTEEDEVEERLRLNLFKKGEDSTKSVTLPRARTSLKSDEEMRAVSVTSKDEGVNTPSVASYNKGEDERQSVSSPQTQASRKTDEMKPMSVTSRDEEASEASHKREEDVGTPASVASYKSALRHTVSTSNLAKKKVLFVDQAFDDSKRSLSENTIQGKQNQSYVSGSESVASLVQEIQQQLSNRSGKPPLSVDLMKRPDSLVKAPDIPLTDILPLTKSGRDLLDSESKNRPKILSVRESSASPELRSPRSLKPLSQILQKVPTTKSGFSSSLGTRPDLLEWSSKSGLQPPKLSPAPSLSSIGSSLLDLSASPRGPRRPVKGSLEWDLQDLEDNMRD